MVTVTAVAVGALQFRGGIRHGRGTELAPNGDIYVGEWAVGLRDGIGQVLIMGWLRRGCPSPLILAPGAHERT